jgi:hypothetical protein
LNLLSELSRLFCDISPFNGIAMKPRFLSNSEKIESNLIILNDQKLDDLDLS